MLSMGHSPKMGLVPPHLSPTGSFPSCLFAPASPSLLLPPGMTGDWRQRLPILKGTWSMVRISAGGYHTVAPSSHPFAIHVPPSRLILEGIRRGQQHTHRAMRSPRMGQMGA